MALGTSVFVFPPSHQWPMSTSPKRFSLEDDIRRLSLTEFLWREVARRLLQTISSSAGWESTTTCGMLGGLSMAPALTANRTFWFSTPAPLCLTFLYFARGIRADILNPSLVLCPLPICSVHCCPLNFSIVILVYPHKSVVFPVR